MFKVLTLYGSGGHIGHTGHMAEMIWTMFFSNHPAVLGFDNPEEEAFSKHLVQKEKMLVTSIFSFTNSIFLPFPKEILILFFFTIILLSAKAFKLGQSKRQKFSYIQVSLLLQKLPSAESNRPLFTEFLFIPRCRPDISASFSVRSNSL